MHNHDHKYPFRPGFEPGTLSPSQYERAIGAGLHGSINCARFHDFNVQICCVQRQEAGTA